MEIEKCRVKYNGKWKTPYEWADQMGYDHDVLRKTANRSGMTVAMAVRHLLGHVYENDPLAMPMPDIRKPKDPVGQYFGRLRVMKDNGDGSYHCLCQCGNECDVLRKCLVDNMTRSCGCMRRENQSCYIYSVKNVGYADCMTLTYKGETKTVREWSEDPRVASLGIKRRNIYSRIKYRGWSVEKTLSTPCKTTN